MSPGSATENSKEMEPTIKEKEHYVSSLCKLDGDEFGLWKIKMKLYLNERGLWEATQTKDYSDKNKDDKAFTALCARYTIAI